jgi:hypothetical protein
VPASSLTTAVVIVVFEDLPIAAFTLIFATPTGGAIHLGVLDCTPFIKESWVLVRSRLAKNQAVNGEEALE